MVYRIYVEKKPGQDLEARSLLSDINSYLNIAGVKKVRMLNRYDVDNINRDLFCAACKNVLAEPPIDQIYDDITLDTPYVFAVEYLPGQFDQRADSAAQCIQLISAAERPTVRTAKIYMLYGTLSDKELEVIKHHVINPVEAREASLEKFDTLVENYDIPSTVPTLNGFTVLDRQSLEGFIMSYGLAMDIDDILFLQDYFRSEHRDPTLTEIRVLDTYWSDHCRHTTFLTSIDDVSVSDPLIKEAYDEYLGIRKELGREKKPMTLMDLATIGCRYLKSTGKLTKLDESEEINACTVKIKVNKDGKDEDWLLLFKNETHNHPTEIEPFGGAATCIGGAIRDPLSGRSYVYAAMRVTGAADPLAPLEDTIPGKLPQKKLTTTAAAGYSSYGNQIGLATGMVDELYHPGYAAKRMEIGAVIAAAPAKNVKRLCPDPGDVVILLGGRTGRDGCGGATGSSKSHNSDSISTCGAEVQKGNAPEERKLQRLFRSEEASSLIKRCNDFGAGGVSVAIGELADGLDIELDRVPKKYAGLNGTELAISESQERMAVVVAPEDEAHFLSLCAAENLEATTVAHVTKEPRLVMHWNDKVIVDISREFLNSNGAEKHVTVKLPVTRDYNAVYPKISGRRGPANYATRYLELASDLNVCSKQGLSERFDSTIGAGTVLMPFGGKNQITPIQAMVHKISVEKGATDTCSLMSWGFNPYITEHSPFHGAYLAVLESVSKLIAAGASYEDIYLTFQEYFEKPGKDPKKFGKPFAALLGAMRAQIDLGIASIGGKDSMSGTFEDLTVPPTLCSFAVTTADSKDIISPEFKQAGSRVVVLSPAYENGLPVIASVKSVYRTVNSLMANKSVLAAYTPGFGGIAEAVMKMCFGNGLGFSYDDAFTADEAFSYAYGSFVLELSSDTDTAKLAASLTDKASLRMLGTVTETASIKISSFEVTIEKLLERYRGKLEPVFSTGADLPVRSYKVLTRDNAAARSENSSLPAVESAKHYPGSIARPRVLIPVFPGTNCEYDSAKAVEAAGAEAKIFVVRNLSSEAISESVNSFADEIKKSQMIFIPGGFSGADEPDGSAKFITAFFRNDRIADAVTELMDSRDGLMCGICNGFQALIKLGLLPYGKITELTTVSPTLTFNTIGRHQSRLVRTRVVSNDSPWLSLVNEGDVFTVPISHGEGRFIASEATIRDLTANGRVATQYVDMDGNPTSDIAFNPNNSACAIEGILSPDGRIFGKMGHSERIGNDLYKNVPGNFNIRMFESAVRYFS